MIGAEIVAKAPADGYTLLMTSNSLVNSPTLFGRAPFDWRKDFAFVTTILEQPMVLEVNLDSAGRVGRRIGGARQARRVQALVRLFEDRGDEGEILAPVERRAAEQRRAVDQRVRGQGCV